MRRTRLSPSFWLGLILCGATFLAALLSLGWTPYDPTEILIERRFLPPSADHVFGTDQFGRDIASMILAGALNALWVAILAVGIGIILGVPLGLFAAARGGWIDDIVMRLNDLIFAFPALILAILLTASLGPSAVNAMIAIGLFNVPVFARLARGSALSLWRRDFILAARAAGKGAGRISIEHILPNMAGLLIVQGTIQFSLAILAEAALSYVGLGTQPPEPSWGRMLAESQTFTLLGPWIAIAPGLAIVLTVMGLNLLGDGLRDWLDPRDGKGRAP